VAKVWRSLVEDWNQRKIRIDNFTRINAGVSIGDTVKISTLSEEIEAKRVVLAPPEDLPKKIPIANNPHVINGLLDFPVVKNDSIPIMLGLPFVQPQIVAFKVVEIEPEEAVIITKNTTVEFSDKPAAGFEGVKRFSYEDIGGLKDELQRLRETIELPLRHPELFQKLGIEPPKGVLLYGPPGTGKTLIAKAVASESGAHFISIAGPEVISKYYGESEQRLREVFEEARENAPSIIFIDELDSIAPRREEVTGEVERRVVAQLLTMMDGLEERGQVVVIGATNRVDAIDAALRRPGRFDREIEIGVPSEIDRIEILKIHTRGMPLAEDVSLNVLAQQTHGFVGADLAALAREAAIRALRRYMPDLDLEKEEIDQETLDKLRVLAADFRSAQRDVGPSAMREVMLEVSHVKWETVGGLDAAKTEVREAVEYPLTHHDRFDELGIVPPRGVLLYGPPGTGKTLIAKAVASESGANFIPVRGPQLLSKWVGESERAVREIFKKARQVSPSIIFFDEIDALAPARGTSSDSHVIDNVLNQILTEMDGLEELKDVVIMGATNRPDIVDPALLRAGRFDRLVYIGEPTLEDRRKIIGIHTQYMPLEGSALEEIVGLTEGFTDDTLGELVEKLGRDKKISDEPIKFVIKEIDEEAKKLKDERRRRLFDLIREKNLAFEDQAFETILDLTEGYTKDAISEFVEKLGKDAKITAEIVKATIKHANAKPSKGARRRRLVNLMREKNLAFEDPARDENLADLARITEGFVGADLEALCREAGMFALREVTSRDKAMESLDKYLEKEHIDTNALANSDVEKIVNIINPLKTEDNESKNATPLHQETVLKNLNEYLKITGRDAAKMSKHDLEIIVKSLIQKENVSSNVTPQHFSEAQKKVHPTMNDNLRDYYGKIQQHFKGGLPKKVQPPEYQ
jgi:transitional endoplasmic reticulum ATPase